MGCCCSLLSSGSGGEATKETEMRTQEGGRETPNQGKLKISRAMTSPSIEVDDETKVSGNGLALVGVVVEQDSAYWEAHVDIDGSGGATREIMVGIATKKDRKFYGSLNSATDGTEIMRKVKVKNEDTVGIAVQQADLPMVLFTLNGEPLHDLSINRFRGVVFPAICLPENDDLSVKLVFDERNFQEMSPNPRIGPLIEARGLV